MNIEEETFTKEEVIEILKKISGYNNDRHWENKLYDFKLGKKFEAEDKEKNKDVCPIRQ